MMRTLIKIILCTCMIQSPIYKTIPYDTPEVRLEKMFENLSEIYPNGYTMLLERDRALKEQFTTERISVWKNGNWIDRIDERFMGNDLKKIDLFHERKGRQYLTKVSVHKDYMQSDGSYVRNMDEIEYWEPLREFMHRLFDYDSNGKIRGLNDDFHWEVSNNEVTANLIDREGYAEKEENYMLARIDRDTFSISADTLEYRFLFDDDHLKEIEWTIKESRADESLYESGTLMIGKLMLKDQSKLENILDENDIVRNERLWIDTLPLSRSE